VNPIKVSQATLPLYTYIRRIVPTQLNAIQSYKVMGACCGFCKQSGGLHYHLAKADQLIKSILLGEQKPLTSMPSSTPL